MYPRHKAFVQDVALSLRGDMAQRVQFYQVGFAVCGGITGGEQHGSVKGVISSRPVLNRISTGSAMRARVPIWRVIVVSKGDIRGRVISDRREGVTGVLIFQNLIQLVDLEWSVWISGG